MNKKSEIPPISNDVVLTDTYDGHTYVYHPFFVGQNIRKLRLAKKMTRRDLANEWIEWIEIKEIALWESGNKLPSLDDLDYLADVIFDVSLSYLLTGEELEEEDEDDIEDGDDNVINDEDEETLDDESLDEVDETDNDVEEEDEEEEEDDDEFSAEFLDFLDEDVFDGQ